ncbi:alpha/beta-hydrolase [Xylariaceae sp. FL1651]|nr:alpha/beta-hydrolase [Xylariaceae sp. FL1651]
MSKPYILLVPGSFAVPEFYDNIVTDIKANGYDMKALHLPTVGLGPGQGRDTPPGTMYDDAALIAKEIETLADAGREVILVAHSYGGMPATESTKGLSLQERRKQGKKGGLVRIAYKTVLLTTPGRSAEDVLADIPQDGPPMMAPDERGWLHHTNPELTASRCFSDLPIEEALRWSSRFSLHSAVSFTNPLTYAGYKDVPISYLLCEEDLIIPLRIQKEEIEKIEKETGSKVDVTSIKASHCPTVSVPQKVVDWILQVAKKV